MREIYKHATYRKARRQEKGEGVCIPTVQAEREHDLEGLGTNLNLRDAGLHR